MEMLEETLKARFQNSSSIFFAAEHLRPGCSLAALNRKLQASITIIYLICRFMQGLAGVPWAKTHPIMLYGKEI
jgi:hypothetical protein